MRKTSNIGTLSAQDLGVTLTDMTDEARQKILDKINSLKKGKKAYRQFVCDTFGCSMEQVADVITTLESGVAPVIARDDLDGVIDMGPYTFNATTGTYIVPLKTYGGNFVITEPQHKALISAYTTWTHGKQRSVEEIGHIYNMTPDMVREYMRKFGISRASMPVTKEELIKDDPKKAVQRLYQTKKLAFDQQMQHLEWKRIQEDAKEWQKFEAGELDPFERILASYELKAIKALPYKNNKPRNDEIFLIGLSDLHFGGLARSSELFSGKDFNAEKIKEIIDTYAQKIAALLNSRTQQFSKAVICSLGDILHTLDGFTVKGVALEADVLREEQFELAFDSLIRFINRIIELFGLAEVHAVKGNHAGANDYILFKALQAYFRNDKRIKFHLYKSRQAVFRIGNTAILIDHGAADSTKAIINVNSEKKENYVQALFLQRPEILQGIKSKLMLQGDRHKFMYDEVKGFDHVVMSSCVLGDRYADQLGLHSRPRQNCLVLNDDGVKEIINFYF